MNRMVIYSNKRLEQLWKELGDIPIDINECILSDFHIWKRGTNRFEIWKWFDDNFEGGLKKHKQIEVYHPNILNKKSTIRLNKEIKHFEEYLKVLKDKDMNKALDNKDFDNAKKIRGRIKVIEKRIFQRKKELKNREIRAN